MIAHLNTIITLVKGGAFSPYLFGLTSSVAVRTEAQSDIRSIPGLTGAEMEKLQENVHFVSI